MEISKEQLKIIASYMNLRDDKFQVDFDPNDGSTQITTPNGRFYTLSDSKAKFWSVTTVLDIVDKSTWLIPYVVRSIKTALEDGQPIPWALSAHSRLLKSLGERGTRVHAWIEGYLSSTDQHGAEPLQPGDEHFTNAFLQDFDAKHEVEVIDLEPRVFHELHVHGFPCHYAGSIDGVIILDGIPTIIDWKTSKTIKDEYWQQLMAYYHALGNEDILQVAIFHMKPTTKKPKGQLLIKQVSELDLQWTKFKAKLYLNQLERDE